MNHINFGVAKAVVSNKISKDFVDNNIINESKKIAVNFFDVIKESNVLQTEFIIYKNIEDKHIKSDNLATRYIDENIKLFENFTKKEVEDAHKKLNIFIDESFINIPDNKFKLYESLDVLLLETTKGNSLTTNIDLIHESFVTILNHLKRDVITEDINIVNDNINDDIDLDLVVELAVNKFNDKYSSLSEDEKNILTILVVNNKNVKKELFESLKNENLNLLNNTKKSDGIEDKINMTINKINEMVYNDNNVVKDVIKLYELKNTLS